MKHRRTIEGRPSRATTQEEPQDRYANGDIWCQTRQRRIEPVICTIQSFREPKKCSGCRYASEETAQRNHNKKEVHV